MKKLLAVILSLAIVLSLGAGMALADDAKTIAAWGAFTFSDQTGITSYSEQYLWQAVEERLGIKVDWTTVPSSDKKTMFSLVMADPSQLPDMLVDMDPLTWEEFGRIGALQALNDYITPELMPNLCALIAQDPEIKAAITSADGNIYFFPRIMEAPTRYWNGYFIREDFLAECGLEVPTTTQEFYDACAAIKEKIDTVDYPISMNADQLKNFVYSWDTGARGVGLDSTGDAYITEAGDIAYGPIQDSYREALVFLRSLNADGLLNPDWNSLSGGDIRTDIVSKTAAVCAGSFSGVMSTYNGLLIADGQGEALTYMEPLYGPEGKRAWQSHHTAIDVSYGGAISSTCSDVESVLKVFDYLYSDEGRETVYWGVEGKTFNMVDGKHVFTDDVTSSDLGVLSYLNNYSGNTSCYPSAMITEFYRATLSDKAGLGNAAITEIGQAHDIRMPALRYTEDEITEVNTILVDLNAYVDEWFALFINGTKDVSSDADWEEYKAGFGGLRLEELMGYYEKAYARFNEVVASVG
ncbi:MAG: extracellular solute-binding protein [Clostridia bacterium]|nr:extracellular solute-binding protein [Clostridia bacterium]